MKEKKNKELKIYQSRQSIIREEFKPRSGGLFRMEMRNNIGLVFYFIFYFFGNINSSRERIRFWGFNMEGIWERILVKRAREWIIKILIGVF